MKLEEFAQILESDVLVTRRLDSDTGEWSLHRAEFDGMIEFKTHKDSGALASIYGEGLTMPGALKDFVNQINEHSYVVINAYSPSRKEMSFGVITL